MVAELQDRRLERHAGADHLGLGGHLGVPGDDHGEPVVVGPDHDVLLVEVPGVVGGRPPGVGHREEQVPERLSEAPARLELVRP